MKNRFVHSFLTVALNGLFQSETIQAELENYKEKVEELTIDLEILRNDISDKGMAEYYRIHGQFIKALLACLFSFDSSELQIKMLKKSL